MAAYDSWNPVSAALSGDNVSCIVSAANRIPPVLLCLPEIVAASPRMMNRNALEIDGPAPVAAVYIPQRQMISVDLAFLADGLFPRNESRYDMRLYIIPRCSPESARICDAPLSLNVDNVVLLMSLRSPVTSAFSMPFALLLLNGRESMRAFMTSPSAESRSVMIPFSVGMPIDDRECVVPVMIPQVNAAVIVSERMTMWLQLW